MNPLSVCLVLATLGSALVAGMTLLFSIVVMPGLGRLGDRGFLEGFKAIDGVIQENQPVFLLVWLGSALVLIAAALIGWGRLEGLDRVLLIAAVVLYLPGVQVATVLVNVPLNNQLQVEDLDSLDDAGVAKAREAFEPRWLLWNDIRTGVALLTSLLLLVLLLRI